MAAVTAWNSHVIQLSQKTSSLPGLLWWSLHFIQNSTSEVVASTAGVTILQTIYSTPSMEMAEMLTTRIHCTSSNVQVTWLDKNPPLLEQAFCLAKGIHHMHQPSDAYHWELWYYSVPWWSNLFALNTEILVQTWDATQPSTLTISRQQAGWESQYVQPYHNNLTILCQCTDNKKHWKGFILSTWPERIINLLITGGAQ